MEKTSDAGSQYCSGRVGRGLQPLILTPHTQTYTKSIQNACFSTFQLDPLGTKTIFFFKPNWSAKYYILFSAWLHEVTKNIFWASDIVATLTHVERFYDLMNLKLFYFAW